MIRMDYGDLKHRKELETAFLSLLDNVPARQAEWVRLRAKLCEKEKMMKNILPVQMKDMMIFPYGKLVEIYDIYVGLNLFATDRELHNDLIDLFSYEKKKGGKFKALNEKIIGFFKKDGRFEIHTCHYCDMAYINCFTTREGNNRTQFDLDHVLPKGKCPLVALCLYNLVPVCPTCNGPHIKQDREMTCSEIQRKKLSPTSVDYDFSGKVELWVRPKFSKVHNADFLKHQQEYEIEFDTSQDSDYENEINFFYLRERYNYHKCLALRLLDLKAKYTPARIREMARIICRFGRDRGNEATVTSQIIIGKIRTDIFGSEFVDNYHRAFGKMYKDILDDD